MRIGELAAATGTSATTLRFYEQSGLLQPPRRRPSGYRDYDVSVVGRLDFIHRWQPAGLRLAQLAQILTIRHDGHAPCQHVRDLLAARLDQIPTQIAELTLLRDPLLGASMAAESSSPALDTGSEVTPHCWCCGRTYLDNDLVHLGEHPEVAVCAGCARYLNRRAHKANASVTSRPLYVTAEKIRDAVMARGWHEHPKIGPSLKWLDRHMPW
jgi:MerR family transcriptional regulator, Zn(II)-responsive regulator of zntA